MRPRQPILAEHMGMKARLTEAKAEWLERPRVKDGGNDRHMHKSDQFHYWMLRDRSRDTIASSVPLEKDETLGNAFSATWRPNC